MLLDLLSEHLSIQRRMPDKERFSIASREDWGGLLDAQLSSSHLTSIARDEVVHALGVGEPRDRWEDSIGVAGEEDDVAWVASD